MKRFLLICSCLASLSFASAQDSSTSLRNSTAPAAANLTDYGTASGTREVMITGGGASNKEFDNSFGSFGLSYGQFFSDSAELVVRQSVSYSNPSNAGSAWNGSTKLAVDYNLGVSQLRPFVGINLGYVYGEAVHDTWAAGLEAGLKYYVRPNSFIAVTADYGFFFDHADDVGNRFSDGQYTWSLGVGFNF